jgi:hypothetical protein
VQHNRMLQRRKDCVGVLGVNIVPSSEGEALPSSLGG